MADAANPDLSKLQKILIATHQQLSDTLADTADPDTAEAIVKEMREVLHRIDLVHSLLFTEVSNEIAATTAKIEDADEELQSTLEGITKAVTVVTAVTKFLGVVDEAIDVAKLVAVA
jgi:hypothetical protein